MPPRSDKERIIWYLLDCYVACGKCEGAPHEDESELAHALVEEFDFSDIEDEETHGNKAREESTRLATWVENMIDNGLVLGMTPKQIMRYLLFMFVGYDGIGEMLEKFDETEIPGISGQ